MKNSIYILIFSILGVSCENSQKANTETENPPTNSISYTLYENKIENLPLPFPQEEMSEKIQQEFENLKVTKETGQGDSPNFPLYSLKKDNNEIAFFAMDFEDTLKLDNIYIKNPLIQDEYGLKVGDNYSKIKQLRKGELKNQTDYHKHTFLYLENSNIYYEITGEGLADTVDYENITLTEEQLKDWKIEYVIWKKRK